MHWIVIHASEISHQTGDPDHDLIMHSVYARRKLQGQNNVKKKINKNRPTL